MSTSAIRQHSSGTFPFAKKKKISHFSTSRKMSSETCYTVVFEDSTESPSTQELRASLEKGTDEVKIDTLRRIIISTINGNVQVGAHSRIDTWGDTEEPCIQPSLLMPIIQYVLPSRNKQLKKLLHFYWEVCPKYDENGKLKQEMILVVYVVYRHYDHNLLTVITATPSEMIW